MGAFVNQRLLKPPLNVHPCFSVKMEITEVKMEPIEHMDPTEYEENLLKIIDKPPVNKVNGL